MTLTRLCRDDSQRGRFTQVAANDGFTTHVNHVSRVGCELSQSNSNSISSDVLLLIHFRSTKNKQKTLDHDNLHLVEIFAINTLFSQRHFQIVFRLCLFADMSSKQIRHFVKGYLVRLSLFY